MVMFLDRSDSVVFWCFQRKSMSLSDSASNFTRDSVLILNFPNFDNGDLYRTPLIYISAPALFYFPKDVYTTGYQII